MGIVWRCAEMTGDCDFRAFGETLEQVLAQAAVHAKREHDITTTAEFIEKARAVIHNE